MCLRMWLRKIRSRWIILDESEEDIQTPTTSTFGLNTESNNEFVHPAVSGGVSKYRLYIHLPVLLAFFAIAVAATPFTNQLLYQTCIYQFNYTREQCEPLLGKVAKTNETNEIENNVQPYVTYQLMANTMITNVLPALFCLAAGPWSDKYGRKPMLMTPLIGYALNYITLSVLSGISVKSNLNPWWFLMASVPVAFTGGACLLITMVFANITDVYSGKYRAFSMIIAQTLISVGDGIGNVAGGIIYDKFNLLTTFIISAVAMTISLLYIIFINVESIHYMEQGSRIRGFFSMDLVRKFWHTSTKKRQPYHRMFICCIIFAVVILNFVDDGQLNICYLFLSKKFNWDITVYNYYKAAISIMSVVGCTLGSFILLWYFKLSMTTLIFIVMLGNVFDSLTFALAAYSWQIYAAKVIGCLAGIGIPTLRSILSMLISEGEVGTIFSINNSLQYMIAIFAAPLYSAVYSATLSYDPAVYNYLSVLFYLICTILVGVIFVLRKHLKLEPLLPIS